MAHPLTSLKGRIKQAGLTIRQAADAVEMTPTQLYHRLGGYYKFKTHELAALMRLLDAAEKKGSHHAAEQRVAAGSSEVSEDVVS